MTRCRGPAEAGAALLEAVVALAAVATVVIGGTELHRATLEARLDVGRTVAALVAASATAERVRIGSVSDGVDGEGPVALSPLWQRRPCDAGAVAVREVPVRPDAASPARGVLRVALPPGAERLVVAVRTSGGAPAPGATVEATTADGDVVTRTADATGCADLGRTSGPVEVVATTAAGATGRVVIPGGHPDGARAPGGAAPVGVAVSGRGRVTVVLATAGALPDRIDGGRLAWWLGGGSGGPVARLGESLDLPEGQQGVVVGACADPRAGGAAAAVSVVPGGDAVVAVPVGHVVVARPEVADGRHLVLRRERRCPGTAERPALVWDVGGGGGWFAAAVPDGAWEAVLEGPDGRRRTSALTVLVSGDSGAVLSW